jgi:hypothetical protein
MKTRPAFQFVAVELTRTNTILAITMAMAMIMGLKANVAFMLFPLLSCLLSILLGPGSLSMATPVAVVLLI